MGEVDKSQWWLPEKKGLEWVCKDNFQLMAKLWLIDISLTSEWQDRDTGNKVGREKQ